MLFVSLAYALALLLSASGTTKWSLPPESAGSIGGRTAVLIWPSRTSGDLLDPADCTAHLVPYADQNVERVFPCGQWFQPERGRYLYWIEKEDGQIAPRPTVLSYSGPAFEGRALRVLLAVAPAGRVVFSKPQAHDRSLRLLHLPSEGDFNVHRSLDRRSPGDKPGPMLMPAGQVLAGVFDRSGNALALARPVQVPAGRTVTVAPAPPRAGTDILAVFDRDEFRSADAAYNLKPYLTVNGVRRDPDVLSDTVNRVVCVWYSVAGATASLTARSQREFVADEEVHLASGSVVTLRRPLHALPRATVSIDAPRDVPPMKVKIFSASNDATPLRVVSVTAGTNTIDALPPENLVVNLEIGKWTFTKRVDLTSGRDANVEFALKPADVHGVVYAGNAPAAAKVTFTTGRKDLDGTDADAAGAYRLRLWSDGVYVARVEVPGSEPFLQGFVEVEGDTSVDFHVPKNRVTVHVTDASSGAPVAAAKVLVTTMADSIRQIETRRTDDTGDAVLPPLKPGAATIEAAADGYEKATPATVPIDSTTGTQRVELVLKKIEYAQDVTIIAPNGQPADQAEVAVLPHPSDQLPRFHGTASASGIVKLPEFGGDALLLVRHRGSASAVVPVAALKADAVVHLTTESTPLVIEAVDADGDPINIARLGIWFGTFRMTTNALGFLTWSNGVPAADGFWVGRGMSPAPARVVAWRGNSADAFRGAFDILAREIRFPWQGVQRVTVVN